MSRHFRPWTIAATYPASEDSSQPRWRYAHSGPHKLPDVERRFLNQAFGVPFDCQIPWGLGLRLKLGQGAVASQSPMEATMLSRADNTETGTSIRTDLRAIFVSLELSRTTWLVTSLSPGTREKMSKHSMPAGDIGDLLARLRSLQERARELSPKVGEGVNRGRRHIVGVFEPPLLHRRSDMPCPTIPLSN
jgi:hypothetical protein